MKSRLDRTYAGKRAFMPGVLLLLPAAIALGFLISRLLSGSTIAKATGVFATLPPSYVWVFIIGSISLIMLLVLQQNEIIVGLIIAAHIYMDWYLGMTFLASFMAAGLLLILGLNRSSERPFPFPRVLWLWAIFLVLALFPTTRAPNFLYGADYYVNIIADGLILLWLGLVIARDTQNIRLLFQILTFVAVLIAIHTLVQVTTGKFLFGSPRHDPYTQVISYLDASSAGVHRAESFLTNADTNGSFFGIMVFMPLALYVDTPRFSLKLLYIASMILMLASLLFTYSTAAWAAALCGLVVFLIFVGDARSQTQIILCIVFITLLVLIFFPAQIALQLQHASNTDEFMLRRGAWQTGIHIIEAFPLTGLGIGRDVYWLNAEPFRVAAQYTPLPHPHNSYIELAALGGLPVLAAFLALLIFSLTQAVSTWRCADTRTRVLLAGGLALVISLSANSMANAGWTIAPLAAIGWLFLGVITSPLLIKNRFYNKETLTEASITSNREMLQGRFTREQQTAPLQRDLRVGVLLAAPCIPQYQISSDIIDQPFRLSPEAHAARRRILERVPLTPEPSSLPGLTTQSQENYLSLLRNLFKSSGIYALGSMASPLIALLLAPFLTRYLSHVEYGALAVLNITIALVAGITQLGLNTSFFRAYNYDYETQSDRMAVLATTVILLSGATIFASLLMFLAAPWLASTLFNNAAFTTPIQYTALVILSQNLTVPGFSWLRAEKRATFSSLLTVLNLLITLFATIFLVGPLHQGINGALLGNAAGYVAVVVCIMPLIMLRAKWVWRMDIVRNLMLFGGPIIIRALSVWVLQLSDRYLLSFFSSLSQTANYAVAYSLGGVLGPIILGPFGLAWPPIMYSISKRKDAMHLFQLIFRWYSILLLFATFAFSLLSIAILDLLFPVSYHSVAELIPIIATSYMFYGVYNMFTTGVYIQRKTSLTVFFTAIAALSNLGLNLLLIPHYGALGAAVSTLLAYMLLALVAYIMDQRIYHVPFEVGLFTINTALGAGLYILSSALAQHQPLYLSWGISLLFLLFYGVCLILLGILWHHKRKSAHQQNKEVYVS